MKHEAPRAGMGNVGLVPECQDANLKCHQWSGWFPWGGAPVTNDPQIPVAYNSQLS